MTSEEKNNEIWAAFDKLYAKLGRTPNYQEVLSEVGRGSNSSIKMVRDKWLKQQEEERLAAQVMPGSINRALHQAANRIWFEMRDLLNAELETVKSEALTKTSALEQENEYFLNQTIKLEEQLSHSAIRQSELKLQLEPTLVKSDSLAAQVNELKIQLAVQARDIEQHEKENASLRDECQMLKQKT